MDITLRNSIGEEVHQLFDLKLEELSHLADQGSYVATSALTKLYNELKAIEPDYAEQAKYWEDRGDTLL